MGFFIFGQDEKLVCAGCQTSLNNEQIRQLYSIISYIRIKFRIGIRSPFGSHTEFFNRDKFRVEWPVVRSSLSELYSLVFWWGLVSKPNYGRGYVSIRELNIIRVKPMYSKQCNLFKQILFH